MAGLSIAQGGCYSVSIGTCQTLAPRVKMGHENRRLLFVFVMTFYVTFAITFTLIRMFCEIVLGVS